MQGGRVTGLRSRSMHLADVGLASSPDLSLRARDPAGAAQPETSQ